MKFGIALCVAWIACGGAVAIAALPDGPPVGRPESPLMPTDRNVPALLVSPTFDLVILAALVWWFWGISRRTGEESRRYRDARLGRRARAGRASSFVVPPDGHSRFRARWAEYFKRVRAAELRRDLESVRDILDPSVFRELETGYKRMSRLWPPETQVALVEAKVVERWSENGLDSVRVRFLGQLRQADERGDAAFDESWVFRFEGGRWKVTDIHRELVPQEVLETKLKYRKG